MTLFPRIVLGIKSFLQQPKVSFFKIEVRPRDYFAPLIRRHPIDNLRSIGPEKGPIFLVEGLAILSRENPDVTVLSIANELEIFLKARQRC